MRLPCGSKVSKIHFEKCSRRRWVYIKVVHVVSPTVTWGLFTTALYNRLSSVKNRNKSASHSFHLLYNTMLNHLYWPKCFNAQYHLHVWSSYKLPMQLWSCWTASVVHYCYWMSCRLWRYSAQATANLPLPAPQGVCTQSWSGAGELWAGFTVNECVNRGVYTDLTWE